ncbi:hypothetical protein 7t3_0411 [Salmonella phage 7t3]|nr:hypothetical protein 7t3_0411 [Salmonella phage 7t3]
MNGKRKKLVHNKLNKRHKWMCLFFVFLGTN